jgi:hypothetical protein
MGDEHFRDTPERARNHIFLMSLAKYGEMERKLELYEKLTVAEAQVAAGQRGRPLDRVMADLKKRIRAFK